MLINSVFIHKKPSAMLSTAGNHAFSNMFQTCFLGVLTSLDRNRSKTVKFPSK